jgi:hypothetical protein
MAEESLIRATNSRRTPPYRFSSISNQDKMRLFEDLYMTQNTIDQSKSLTMECKAMKAQNNPQTPDSQSWKPDNLHQTQPK